MTLKQKYDSEAVPMLKEKLKISNNLAVPRIVKIMVSCGLGEALTNKKSLEKMSVQLAKITGQKPKINIAKKSIANFKLGKGNPIGLTVTLRGRRMWHFLKKLINVVLPRLRDFRGLSPDSFDQSGNYSFGFREQTVFPEVSYDDIDKVRGFQVTITTNAGNTAKGRMLLELLGMPFKKI